MKKIVLTGAAGNLGSHLREPLSKMGDVLLSTDIAEDVGTLYPGETYVKADIAEMAEVAPLMEGADMVVHFAAIVDEAPFERLLGPNFIGSYNVWEAGYQAGVRRIIYASSIHAVGMYPKQTAIGIEADHRPDGFYGLAKCFTEDLGKMYWDKRGLESVHLRILSCVKEPSNPRALGSWLSYGDMVRLVTRAIDTPTTGFSVIYGVSNNDRCPVDNTAAAYLGYRSEDNAEAFAEEVLAAAPQADPQDPAQMYHGGPFAAVDIGESGMARMNIVTEKKST